MFLGEGDEGHPEELKPSGALCGNNRFCNVNKLFWDVIEAEFGDPYDCGSEGKPGETAGCHRASALSDSQLEGSTNEVELELYHDCPPK